MGVLCVAQEGGLCLGVLRGATGCKWGAGMGTSPLAAERRVDCRSRGARRGMGGGGGGASGGPRSPGSRAAPVLPPAPLETP